MTLANRREAAAKGPATTTAVVAAPAAELELPADFTFKRGDSPGEVVFSHASHVDDQAPRCSACHARDWSLQQPGTPLRGKLVHAQMDKGALCGACRCPRQQSLRHQRRVRDLSPIPLRTSRGSVRARRTGCHSLRLHW